MYALPHHVASFEKTSTASSVIPGMRLQSPTKGMMTAVVADKWRLVESNLPTGYASWLPNKGAGFTNGTVMDTVRRAAEKEVNMDVENLSNLESMYFSGKVLHALPVRSSLCQNFPVIN